MNIFVPHYAVADDGAKVISCFAVTIWRPVQFDYVVSLLSFILSFRLISKAYQENLVRLGAAIKIDSVFERDAYNVSRITCALGLQIIAPLMDRRRALSVAADVSTDDFGRSHVDDCIRMPGGDVIDDLLSLHLLAIPLFEETHGGASLFNVFPTVFGALCPTWKMNIIG